MLRLALAAAVALLSLAPLTNAWDGCSTRIHYDLSGLSVECDDPCAEDCSVFAIHVPGVGSGRICGCGGGETWSGCCTVMLRASGGVVEVGTCGKGGCRGTGECHFDWVFGGGPEDPYGDAEPYCD